MLREAQERLEHSSIDSRSVFITNKEQMEEWRKEYGEDSDFFKVRVKGEFPSQSDKQFIPSGLVMEAARRERRTTGRRARSSAWTWRASVMTTA